MSKPEEFRKVHATDAEAADAQRQLEELKTAKPWYKAEIGPRLKPSAREFYKAYVKLEGEELLHHLYAIRDLAWPLGEYPCVGQWQWLWSILPTFKGYSVALERIIKNGSVLDLGCCFGQELRQLAADGAPTHNMYASDLHSELWELGYDLYRDREIMKACFIQADILDENSHLNKLTGKVDVFIICQVLHLFSWEDQIKACKMMVRMSRSDSLIIGYQLGQTDFQSHTTPWGTMCFHNAKTFRQMWAHVAEETKTSWDIGVEEVHPRDWGTEPEDSAWMGPTILGLNFTITRINDTKG